MKWTALFLITVIMHLCIPAFSQRVSIDAHELPLEQVFKEISSQTGIEFFYQSVLLKGTKPVTIHVQQMLVEDVLKRCLEGQGLQFTLRANTIVLYRQEALVQNEDAAAAPPLILTGRVSDTKGLPIDMSSVVLQRTQTGTQTNRQGTFTLKIQKQRTDDSIVISCVGFKPVRVAVNNRTDLGGILLETADNTLDEVMTVAYGTTSDRYRTGDITTVKASAIERTPALNVTEALAGRVAGLYVRQNGSNPGSVFNIQLRGVNVLPSTTDMARGKAVEVLSKPLIVLDGLPMPPDILGDTGQYIGTDAMTGMIGASAGQDPLYFLNPLDIESITVLKDAEATALYGSRAANGVLIINTKKGKPGKTALNINFNTGINALPRRVKLLHTEQYLAMRNEAIDNFIRYRASQNTPITRDELDLTDLDSFDASRSVDWQKTLLGNAPVYNAGIALSGGEDRTSYRLSAGYNAFKSSYPHLQGKVAFRDEKGTMLLSISSRSKNNRLRMNASAAASTTASWQPATNPDANIFLLPNAPAIFNSEGQLNFSDWTSLAGHPLAMLAKLYTSKRFTVLSRFHFSYEIFRPLVFTLAAGYLKSSGKQVTNHPAASIDPAFGGSVRWALLGNNNNTVFNIEPNLGIKFRWARHYLDVLAGASYQSDSQEGEVIRAAGYVSDEQMGSLAGATAIDKEAANVMERRSVSALARISYRYADKWLLDLSGRRDGSSSFGPARRFGNFGSLGWGWVFSQESWAEKIPLLTWGKIRGSYGITGSQNATPYVYLSSFATNPRTDLIYPGNSYSYYLGSQYGDLNTLRLARASNPSLGWAQAAVLELGADLYMLKDQRLKLSMQWYRKRTANQLVNHQVSSVTGSLVTLLNLPAKVQNSGVEAMLDYNNGPGRPKAIHWNIQFNIAVNKNKLIAYPGLESSPFSTQYEIGKSIDRQQLYTTFINQTLGYYSSVDSIHLQPVIHSVSRLPAFTGGMQAGVSWREFSLFMSCTFAKQQGFTNVQGTSYPGVLPGSGLSNQAVSAIHNDRWRGPGNIGRANAFHIVEVGNNALDIYWGNAAYIALKNASLTYSCPQNLVRKLPVNELSVYIRGENLAIFSLADYKGMNPEQPALLNQQLPMRSVLVGGFTINL